MSREQRSRHRLPAGTVCYLCGELIVKGEEWDRDHVPPERVFGKTVKQQHAVDLNWLPAHRHCNWSYKADEEYFVAAWAGQHHTPTARSVWDDIKRGAAEGHSHGLIKTILGQFGKVALPDGTILFQLDSARAHRVAWKIVRGVYTRLSGRTLPDDQPRLIEIIPASEASMRLPEHSWFSAVSGTPSLGRHQAVFDFKWICLIDGFRGNAMAMLFWDSLIVLAAFHDPACACDACSNEGPPMP